MTTLLKDGLVAFVKRACPTCTMIESPLAQASRARADFQVVTQDDPAFPAGVANLLDDRALDHSWHAKIEATPTLVRYRGGEEVERIEGWRREDWQRLTGLTGLGSGLPPWQPG